MNKWYVRHLDETVGPLDLSEIADLLKMHQLTWLDFAHSGEPGAEWKLLWQVDELREQLTEKNLAGPDDGWILKRDHEAMRGPYSLEALKAMLASGEIKFNDQVWTEGMPKWFKVSERPEFNRGRYQAPAAAQELVAVQEVFVAEAFMRDVVRRQTPTIPGNVEAPVVLRKEIRPLEADGDDLLDTPAWMKPHLLALLCFAISSGSLTAGAATKLKMSAKNLDGGDPSIAFDTDASSGETIQLHVVGRSGDILALASYDKSVSLPVAKDSQVVYRIKNLNLPAGTYEVDASLADQHDVQTMFIGVRDQAFEDELARHQKQISGEQQAEKKALFYGAKQLRGLSQKLYARFNQVSLRSPSADKTWSAFYRNWKKQAVQASAVFDALKNELAEHSGFMFPDQVASFQQAAGQLSQLAERVNRAPGERGVASESVNDVPQAEQAKASESKFKSMMESAASLSVYGDPSQK